MNKFSIQLTGMYPRSEALIRATRDFDRKRISPEQLSRILRGQQKELINKQKELKVSALSDGLLNWQDHFRPFSELFSGIKPTALTRFTDTNTFFRRPQVDGPVKYLEKDLRPYFAGVKNSGKWQATLPAPFYFARLADDKYYQSLKKLTLAFSNALIKLIQNLRKHGYHSFHLFDPYLGYLGASKKELNLIQESIQLVVEKSKAGIGYQVAYSCKKEIINTLLKTNLDAIGIDFFNTDITMVPAFYGKKILMAGCLDSRTSLVEDPKIIKVFLRLVNKYIKPRQIIATSNIDLQFVPTSIADRKINNLKLALNI